MARSNDDDAPLLALVYWVDGGVDSSPPEGFAGPKDQWHYHQVTCAFGDRYVSADNDPTLTADTCLAGGGQIVTGGGWMLHVWVVPGIDPPEGGIFAP